MSKKVERIFQERALIEKTLLKCVGEYSPTGDADFDAMVREHLLQDVTERSESFILSLYDIAHAMTFTEWQDFWFDMGICLRRAKFSQQHRTKSVTHESAKLISRQS